MHGGVHEHPSQNSKRTSVVFGKDGAVGKKDSEEDSKEFDDTYFVPTGFSQNARLNFIREENTFAIVFDTVFILTRRA